MQYRRIPFVHRLAVGVVTAAALAGCSSAGTITGGNGTTGRDAKGGNTTGGNGTAGGIPPQASATKPGTPAGRTGPKWVISMPDSVLGYPRVSEDRGLIPQMEAGMQSGTAQLGITGQSIHAAYDDGKDGLYLILYGVNGEGFDPAILQKQLEAPTSVPSNTTVKELKVDPGPHGGNDACSDTWSMQTIDTAMGTMSADSENTDCMWMTSTTFGIIGFWPKADNPSDLPADTTPAVVGPAMIKVRDAIEHQQG